MSGALQGLVLATAIGCGLNGGAFFTFSTFTMAGLKRLPPTQGLMAMQSINVTAPTPAFMTLLFGTALLALVTGVYAGVEGELLVVAGCAVYLLGTIVVTMAANVPRNNHLAGLDPEDRDAPGEWVRYASEWTAWNHLRTLSGAAAAVLLTVALMSV
jgi:uncharacterized membrane protein